MDGIVSTLGRHSVVRCAIDTQVRPIWQLIDRVYPFALEIVATLWAWTLLVECRPISWPNGALDLL